MARSLAMIVLACPRCHEISSHDGNDLDIKTDKEENMLNLSVRCPHCKSKYYLYEGEL